MTTLGQFVLSPEKRRHTRVIFNRSVKLFTQEKGHGQYPARNLSLGGLFVEGDISLPIGEDCRLELHETGRHSSLVLNFFGKIQRCERDGVGVQFTGMEDDSYMFLQTMILYSSDDPLGVAEDFFENFTPRSVSTC